MQGRSQLHSVTRNKDKVGLVASNYLECVANIELCFCRSRYSCYLSQGCQVVQGLRRGGP